MTLRSTLRTVARLAGVPAGLVLAVVANGQTPPSIIPPADTPPQTIPLADAPPTIEPIPSAPGTVSIVTPSKPNPGASSTALPQMLADARTAYARVRDYVCHYVRREAVDGRLVPEEKCVLRVRTKPFSVAVEVVAPKEYAHRETTYIAGRNNGKVWFRDANTLKHVSLDLDDPKVLHDTRHLITDTGVLAVLDRVERAVTIERRLNHPVQVLVSEYTLAGRTCRRYEIFCDRPHALRYAARHVVFVDTETKLPVRYEAYAQPTPGGEPGGELIEMQSFLGMKLNQGIGDSAFER